MTATEILNVIEVSKTPLHTVKFSSNYKKVIDEGKCLPSTKTQANYFVSKFKNGLQFNVLNNIDVITIEKLLNKYDLKGSYVENKNRRLCRLKNTEALLTAIKKEWKI